HVRGRADLLSENAHARAQSRRGPFRARSRLLVQWPTGRSDAGLDRGPCGEPVQSVGQEMRGGAGHRARGRGALNVVARAPRAARRWRASWVALALLCCPRLGTAQSAPERLDRGRFTAVYYPGDALLAK